MDHRGILSLRIRWRSGGIVLRVEIRCLCSPPQSNYRLIRQKGAKKPFCLLRDTNTPPQLLQSTHISSDYRLVCFRMFSAWFLPGEAALFSFSSLKT